MTLEYLTFANAILLTRLVYLLNDGPLSRRQVLGLGLFQAILLAMLFRPSLALWAAWAVIAGLAIMALALRFRVNPARGHRLLGLFALLVIPAYAGTFDRGFEFSGVFLAATQHLHMHLPFLSELDRGAAMGLGEMVLGLLILANETNIVIRAAFHHLGLEPTSAGEPGLVDRKEYNAGRVIGILERWLMFLVVVVSDDLGALAFIIAAKGLARLKQLEDRQFAEYMLVGTLLSAVFAVFVAFGIKAL